jgi:hypothetical protein
MLLRLGQSAIVPTFAGYGITRGRYGSAACHAGSMVRWPSRRRSTASRYVKVALCPVSGDNDGNGSFRIVDISNPVQPVLKAEW